MMALVALVVAVLAVAALLLLVLALVLWLWYSYLQTYTYTPSRAGYSYPHLSSWRPVSSRVAVFRCQPPVLVGGARMWSFQTYGMLLAI